MTSQHRDCGVDRPADRRSFLQITAASAAVASSGLRSSQAVEAANRANAQVVLGVMGMGGRGTELAKAFCRLPGTQVAYVCDPDQRRVQKAAQEVEKACGKTPKQLSDYRRILDDSAVDALVCAAPDHWHSPAGIAACAAGKHAYLEKPISHNPHEGELLVAASKKHNRVIQQGTQRRSMPGVVEAIQKTRSGAIGQVLFSRGWYNNQRPSIGQGQVVAVPEWLDFELWQGPAPARRYTTNLLHYNWHWFWDYGTGELGNNGIHALDLCRWGLEVDTPIRVCSGGGKYRYPEDDQETPDTQVVTWDFPGHKSIVWEGRSWHRRGFEESMFGVAFYGTEGAIVIDGGGYRQFDMKGKLVHQGQGSASQTPHLQNFLDAVTGQRAAHADAQTAHHSVMLCHYGNIAFRTGQTLHIDPTTGQIKDAAQARAFWKREYRPNWEPQV